jgi:hypothetical protein
LVSIWTIMMRFSRRSSIFFSKFARTPAFIGVANSARRLRDRPSIRVRSRTRCRSGWESAELRHRSFAPALSDFL